MSDQPSDWQTPPPQPPPTPSINTTEPMTSVQSQIGLLVTAVFTVIAYVFHKDFSALVPAVSTLALAIYGAAIAIARAWKHSTNVQAQTRVQQLALDHYATVTQPRQYALHYDVAKAFHTVDDRLDAVEAAVVPKTTSPKRPVKKAAKKTTRRARPKPPPL